MFVFIFRLVLNDFLFISLAFINLKYLNKLLSHVKEVSKGRRGPYGSMIGRSLIAVHWAIIIHPDVLVVHGTVQLDVVRHGLVDVEVFHCGRRTFIVGFDTAVREAVQVLAVESLEGEHDPILSSLYRLHLEFLLSAWLLILEGSDTFVLVSLEPSIVFNL